MRLALAFGALLCTLSAASCGDGQPAGEATTTTGVERIVALAPRDVASVRVEAEGEVVEVDLAEHPDLAPLLAARSFEPVEAPSSYGLDEPRARLVYERAAGGEPVVVEIGGPTVDEVFLYVRRAGDGRIYLAAAETLTPLLP